MATILVGYDTETAAVGETLSLFTESPKFPLYRLALDPQTCADALELLTELHADVGVPATLFVCGRTLLHALEPMRKAKASGLFDVQQHTFSHVPFKDIVYSPGPGLVGTIRASPQEALLEELTVTSRLIQEQVGGEPVVGVRTPFGYHRGLRDRPDLLEVVRAAGLRYVTSWGRNEENGNPTPWVQPFAYAEEGFPDLLEIPFQFWLDGIWFDANGYSEGRAFRRALEGAVDEIAEQDLVFATAFHEWCAVEADEEGTGWIRGLIEHALERGVEVMSYADYWARTTAGNGG
jgi:peptidoglycan/xylan/chitin deacetylase (PgdA/CDA1 family)